MKRRLYTWSYGASRGLVVVTSESYQRGPHGETLWEHGGFVATTNGEVWSAVRASNVWPVLEGIGVGRYERGTFRDPLGILETAHERSLDREMASLMRWGESAARIYGERHSKPAEVTSTTQAMIAEATGTEVRYVDFDGVDLGRHGIQRFHKAVSSALEMSDKAWSWRVPSLNVKTHQGKGPLGQAFAPGTGTYTGLRSISIHRDIARRYDADSLRRVVLHELCHHAREELEPRTGSRAKRESHDSTFCRMMGLVDPQVIGDEEKCRRFHDAPDLTLVAEEAAEATASSKGLSWDPANGFVDYHTYLRGRRLYGRLAWSPKEGSKRRWRPVLINTDDLEMLQLLHRFEPEKWSSVEVSLQPEVRASYDVMRSRRADLPDVRSLRSLAVALVMREPEHFTRTAEYIRSVSDRIGRRENPGRRELVRLAWVS